MADKADYKESFESRVQELERENQQLVVHLHRAQELLESGYAAPVNGNAPLASAHDELSKAFAENLRLQALVQTQRTIHQIESSNALNVKLGNLLIAGADGRGTLFSALGNLARIWRQSSRQVPPAELGGKEFTEVIKAYEKGGFALVEQLFAGLSVSTAMQANAYTVLARRLMEHDRVKASEAARRAHELDPKSFRLKWLAFRLHESGNVVEAEAALDILPSEMPFSDSEARQARLLRHEAKLERELEAKQRAASFEQRTATEAQLSGLAKQRDEQAKLAADREREIQTLKNANLKLTQESRAMAERNDAQFKLVAERNQEIASLKHAIELLRQDQDKRLEQKDHESHSLLENLNQIQDELEHIYENHERLQQAAAQLEQEKQVLLLEREAGLRVAQRRDEELEALRQAMRKVEHEKQLVSIEHNVYLKFVETRSREIEAISQAKMSLEHENNKLTVERELQNRVAAARDREFEALNQAKAQLSQEVQAVAARHDAQVKALETRERDIEGLKQTQAHLEREKQDLLAKHDQQVKTTKAREGEIEALKKANLQLTREKAALLAKNQISARNAGGNDAEIEDFIVDLELFFSGKAIVYVDVGSYVGDVFLKIKRVAKRFRIHEAHLFEPNPVSYERLLEKVSAEDVQTFLHTYNLAVGSVGEQQFVKAKSMTKAISAEVEGGGVPADVFTARSVSLDSQRSTFTDGKINLLKIDVEGQELAVLGGARDLLAAQGVDILYIEVGFNRSGMQQTYFAEIDRFLQPLGYRVLRIYEQKEEWMAGSPLLRRANIAYMSEKFANAHPLKLMHEVRDLKAKLDELNGVTAGN